MNELNKTRIKMLCAKSNITMGELAQKIGITAATLSCRLRNPIFNFREQREIAAVLGCSFRPSFVNKNDGTEITGDTLREIVKAASNKSKLTIASYTQSVGKSQSSFASRLGTEKFKASEIAKIADYFGYEYKTAFIYEDGTIL